jgi:hypothetical protein
MVDIVISKIFGEDLDLMFESLPPEGRLIWHIER